MSDGSFTEQQLGVGANGQGTQMTLQDSSLEALGLEGFSVKGNFDIKDIDKALSKVTESLSEMGARTIRLDSNINNTRVSKINQTAAKSSVADLDNAKAIMNLNKQNILDQYKNTVLKQQAKQQQQLGLIL